MSLAPTQVFITGSTADESFLIEQVESGATVAKAWTNSSGPDEEGHALCEVGGFLVIGGRFDGDAALLKVSSNGNLVRAYSYLGVTAFGRVEGLVPIYDQGLIVAGGQNGGTSAEWTTATMTARTLAGSWAPVTISIGGITGTSSSPEGVLTLIADGVHDTGGGNSDALASLAPVP